MSRGQGPIPLSGARKSSSWTTNGSPLFLGHFTMRDKETDSGSHSIGSQELPRDCVRSPSTRTLHSTQQVDLPPGPAHGIIRHWKEGLARRSAWRGLSPSRQATYSNHLTIGTNVLEWLCYASAILFALATYGLPPPGPSKPPRIPLPGPPTCPDLVGASSISGTLSGSLSRSRPQCGPFNSFNLFAPHPGTFLHTSHARNSSNSGLCFQQLAHSFIFRIL